MERFEIGMLAKSIAGHDKDQIYVIFEEDDEYVYLVDGKYKTIGHSKKKNKKHIQVIRHIEKDFNGRLQNSMDVRNEDIKRLIKLYQARN